MLVSLGFLTFRLVAPDAKVQISFSGDGGEIKGKATLGDIVAKIVLTDFQTRLTGTSL
jgi:hypothetical protein